MQTYCERKKKNHGTVPLGPFAVHTSGVWAIKYCLFWCVVFFFKVWCVHIHAVWIKVHLVPAGLCNVTECLLMFEGSTHMCSLCNCLVCTQRYSFCRVQTCFMLMQQCAHRWEFCVKCAQLWSVHTDAKCEHWDCTLCTHMCSVHTNAQCEHIYEVCGIVHCALTCAVCTHMHGVNTNIKFVGLYIVHTHVRCAHRCTVCT